MDTKSDSDSSTTTRGEGLIDISSVPHIVESIVGFLPFREQQGCRATCRLIHNYVDRQLPPHIAVHAFEPHIMAVCQGRHQPIHMLAKAGVRAFRSLPRVVDFPVYLYRISAETTDIFSNVEVVRHWRERWGQVSKPLENRTSVYFPWFCNPHRPTVRLEDIDPSSYPYEFKADLFPSSTRFSSPTKVVVVIDVDSVFDSPTALSYLDGWDFSELVVVFMALPHPSQRETRNYELSRLLEYLYSLSRCWYQHRNQLPKSARPVKVTFVNSDPFYAESDFGDMRSTLQEAYSRLVSADAGEMS